mgnify:CR=1 FL=1
MILPVKILSALAGLSLAGGVHARVWTNDRGATVTAALVAVRDAEVDLKLKDGRVVAVPRNIFSGADQEYIQEWVKSGGTLPDTDVGNALETGKGDVSYTRLEPNWNADWPQRAGLAGFLLVKTVQETDDLSIYETDHFIIESPGRLAKPEQEALARRFESILRTLAAVPLNLTVARKPSRKYLVRVCFSEEEMEKVPGLRNGRLKFSPTSFTALLLRDKKGNPVNPDAVDPRFAVTHWVMQSLDVEHWLVDGFPPIWRFFPGKKMKPSSGRFPEGWRPCCHAACVRDGIPSRRWRTCWRGTPPIPPPDMTRLQREKARNTGPICCGQFIGAIWKGRAGPTGSGATSWPGMRKNRKRPVPFCWTAKVRWRCRRTWRKPGKSLA